VFAPAGTPLVAIRDGRVVETGDDGGRGNYVAIWSPAVSRTFVYLHMLRPSRVGPGKSVRAGERVGAVGCSGSCWGDHLHLEVRRGRGTTGRPLDPLPVLRRLAAHRVRPE
jgi:murein DD-endopeptidase MepM/ murein hydrolase activator NlpD